MDRSRHVCYTAVHGLVEAQRDPEVRCALSQAGLATEDEMPLVRWCRRSGFPDAGRVAGSDLLAAMCALAVRCDRRHYFYGGSPGVVEKLVARLTQRYPGLVVAGYRSPLFPPLMEEKHAADVAAINEARPDFVWVGLGVPPKQEKWMASHVGRIDAAALIGIGAAFDFHAETKPRDATLRARMAVPARERALVDNSIFVACAIQQRTGWKSYAQDW